FVHDHRARLEAEPRCIQERCNASSHCRCRHDEKETIQGISLSEHGGSPCDGRLHELNLATKNDRDELTDDNAETPGRQNCVEGSVVQWTYDEAFDNGPHHDPGYSCHRIGEPCVPAKLRHHEPGIAADGEEAPMGEIHDLQNAEDDEKSGRDSEQYCGA